jgi:hypothetical protein
LERAAARAAHTLCRVGCLPEAFVEALNRTLSTLTDLQADQPALAAELAPSGADLQRFYFDALQFARLAESFGPHSLFDITLRPGRAPLARAPSRVHVVHPQHRAGATPAAATGRGAEQWCCFPPR